MNYVMKMQWMKVTIASNILSLSYGVDYRVLKLKLNIKGYPMRYSEIKNLLVDVYNDRSMLRGVLSNLGEDDFEVDNYRFIKEDATLEMAIDMYEGDSYMLGCFNADFISDNTDLDYEIVKALQEGDKYEAIGKHILDNDYIGDMMEEYIRLDGYGSVFGSYDGNYEEVVIDGEDYIFMRVN